MAKGERTAETRSRIEKRVFIQAPPEIIYRALTDARQLIRWFCDRATADAREGGEIVVYWKARGRGQRGRAVFSKLVPPTSVELTWLDDGSRHSLTYSIRPMRSSTEVHLVDDGDPFPDDESAQFVSDGWNSVLLELKEHCERRQRLAKPRSRSEDTGRDDR